MPPGVALLAAALIVLPAASAAAQEARMAGDLVEIPPSVDRPHEIGILKGAQELAPELVVGRRVVTRSGLDLGEIRELGSVGGEPVAHIERPVLFGLFADGKTVPLSLLRPFGRDRLLVIGSRRTLRDHPAWSN